MSGGHFDYEQYKIGYIADAVEQLILDNNRTDLNEWGDSRGNNYPAHIIKRLELARETLRKAQIMAQRIDWLVSGDDSEESFVERWEEELGK